MEPFISVLDLDPDSQHNALPAGPFEEVTHARHDGLADVAVDPNFGSGDRMERVADQLSVTGRRETQQLYGSA